MSAHSAGQFIVDVAGEWAGRGCVECIQPYRGGQGKDLDIDRCLIHGRNAAGADIQKFGLKFSKLRPYAREKRDSRWPGGKTR